MNGIWENIEPMTISRSFFAAATVRGRLVFAFGGKGGFDNEPLNTAEVYDSQLKSWSSIPSMRYPRYSFAAGVVKDEVYLFGGLYHAGYDPLALPNYSVELAPSEIFNTRTRKWKLLPSPMTQSRNGPAAAAIGDNIFVMGGYGDGQYLDSMEVYNIQSQAWATLPPMNSTRQHCAAVAVGSSIFVIGGTNDNGSLGTAEMYDVASRSWAPIPPMQFKRTGCSAVALGNSIFVAGGSDDLAEVYNIDERTWTPLPAMQCKRYFCSVSHIDENVLVLGGNYGGSSVEIFKPSASVCKDTIASDNLKSKILSLDIASDEPKSKLLYLDAANYTSKFFMFHDRWNLTIAEKAVKKFCDTSKRSGFTIVAFIDQAAMTEEAQQKWRRRREREVRRGERSVPQGALRLVGDMLAKHGVEVRYSLEADCDDTIAFHAQVDGAGILSQDKDFLRYKNATYALYKDYEINKRGRLKLIEQDGTRKSSWRDLGPPPETSHCDPFRDCIKDGTYLRGSPSPLVRLGSLHILVRQLRAALYCQLGVGSVHEEFPIRSGKNCVWDKQEVHSDDACAELLLSPVDAVKFFQQARPESVSDEDWIKHQFALRSIVAELCCTADGSTLLETLLPLMDSIDIPPQQTKKEKRQQRKAKIKTSSPTSNKSHYLEWRKSQQTGETKKEKRERYLRLFPDKGLLTEHSKSS